jgi:hypothetical protein
MQIQRLLSQARHVAAMGSLVLQKVHLFYYASLKPSLVFRGVAKYSADRIVSYSIKPTHHRLLEVHVRDNGVGMITIAEFFFNNLPLCQPIYRGSVQRLSTTSARTLERVNPTPRQRNN